VLSRAAALTSFGTELKVETFDLPRPHPGGILVKVLAATVCGTDVHLWEGALEAAQPVQLPVIPGHEMVGEVVELGDPAAVDALGRPLKAGDRIVWAPDSCGHCYHCTLLREPTLCEHRRIGMMQSVRGQPYVTGGFAEYTHVLPGAPCLLVPAGLKDEWAAAASCALRTVVRAFEIAGPIESSSCVVIQGAGALGLFATALAALRGAGRVIVIGGPEARLAIATAFGADQVLSISISAEARLEAILDSTGGLGAEVVLELSGSVAAFGEGLALTARGGRYVVAGILSGSPSSVPVHLIAAKQLRVMGSFGAGIDAYAKALQIMSETASRFPWDSVFGRSYPLERATEALLQARSGEEIKPVVRPWLASEAP